MKSLLSVLLFASAVCQAQPIAILDLNFKLPVTRTDSFTLEHLSKGGFPVYIEDIKAIIKTTESLNRKINQGRYNNTGSNEIPIGHSKLILHAQINRHSSLFTLILSTKSNGMEAYLELVKGSYDRTAQQKVIAFLEYLRDNIFIAEESISKN